MITICEDRNNKIIDYEIKRFPDGTYNLINIDPIFSKEVSFHWNFDSNEEIIKLYFLTKHIRNNFNIQDLYLNVPYLPYARQDRVKNYSDMFSLKYLADIINSLNFKEVVFKDVHSNVATALFNNSYSLNINPIIYNLIESLGGSDKVQLFYPDEGARKRYDIQCIEYSFGFKIRDFKTGKIKSYEIAGEINKDKDILIVDDICSKGGTFLHAAKKLKEVTDKDIYLYVTHCENTILDGELINSGLITKIYTTDSIFRKKHELIEIL